MTSPTHHNFSLPTVCLVQNVGKDLSNLLYHDVSITRKPHIKTWLNYLGCKHSALKKCNNQCFPFIFISDLYMCLLIHHSMTSPHEVFSIGSLAHSMNSSGVQENEAAQPCFLF